MSYTVGSTRVINTTSASGTTDFTFTFPYIKEAHIEVYKDYTKLNQGAGATEYQVITNVSPKLVRLGTATASANVRLEIRRNSSLDTPLVDYADGSTLTANDLDTSALQSLYIDQELKDSQFQTVSISATTGLPTLNNNPLTEVADPTNAQDAATKNYVDTNDALKLAKAGDSMTGALAMGTNKVTGVGDPTAAQDAATKSYVDALSTGGLDSRYYTETELDAGQLDNRYYTETESDARYFNTSTGDTIKDGNAFPDNDTTIATTAAINDRIVDLVDDVGGFVPIANETSFPTTNPDVNDGTGTLVSIKAFAASHTPSGGTVTIANGAGSGNTVTITGCGTTVLAADYGGIVETTATLHTYSFHRLVPKATEVTSVATNVSPNITNINTVANNISDVNNFADLYQIASSAPSTDGGGNALADGDLYFNTTTNELQVYNGSAWQGGVTVNTTPSSIVSDDTSVVALESGGTFSVKTTLDGTETLRITSGTGGNYLAIPASIPLHLGSISASNGAGIQLNGTGTDSTIALFGSGSLKIKSSTSTADEDMAVFTKDGAAELFHDGTKKIETTSGGATVSGVATVGGLVLGDGEIIKLGASQDLQIYHENTTHTTRLHAYADRTIDICYNETSSGLKKSLIQCYTTGEVRLNYANTQVLTTSANGVEIVGSHKFVGDLTGNADTVTVTADDGTDATHYPLFTGTASGNLAGETDSGFTYNPSSGYLTATRFIGRLQGSAGQVTASANNSTDETVYLTFIDGATGDQDIETDTGLTYNPSTGNITANKLTDEKGDVRSIPQNTQGSAYTLVAGDAGKHILASGTVTVPDSVFSAGDAVTIVNNTASALTITKTITTMYMSSDGTSANRTLAARGMATILFCSGTVAYISGAGLS